MPIKQTTPQSTIRAELMESAARAKAQIIEALRYAGEAAVREARSHSGHTYTDRTANLRSSTGYVIAQGGRVIASSGFDSLIGTEGSASAGPRAGRQLAEALARENAGPLALIVVAGMSYASYVADRGYNVLDSSERTARETAARLTAQLQAQWKRSR